MRRLGQLCNDERGATAVEYAVILALIFLAMIVGLQAFSASAIAMWNNVATEVSAQ